MNPTNATRIPVKVHRQVALIRSSDPFLVREILARKPLARLIAGRLSETVLLVHAEEEETLLEELKRMGQTPRIVR